MTPSPPPTQTPSSQTASGGQAAPRHGESAADSLAHLHKMSTTAGLGSQEYVAVNVTAVVAVLFGVASVLAVLGYVLLVIPIVGVVVSLVALSQIRDSNGTQTGRGLAWLGLILSAGITVTIVGYDGAQILRSRSDARQISQVAHDFGQDLADGRFDDAYALFDDTFQQRVGLNDFKAHLTGLQHGKYLPSGIEWNGLAVFQTADTGVETAEAMVKMHYKGIEGEERAPARFRREGNTWLIDDLPRMFPPPRMAPDNSN